MLTPSARLETLARRKVVAGALMRTLRCGARLKGGPPARAKHAETATEAMKQESVTELACDAEIGEKIDGARNFAREFLNRFETAWLPAHRHKVPKSASVAMVRFAKGKAAFRGCLRAFKIIMIHRPAQKARVVMMMHCAQKLSSRNPEETDTWYPNFQKPILVGMK